MAKRVSSRDWFWFNLKIGALSFGSSGRLLLYQDGVTKERDWMSDEEFQEILTVAQVLPGPNLVNLSLYLGLALAGFWASFWGLLGLAIPGAFLALGIVSLVDLSNVSVRLLFDGFSMASVVLFSVFIQRLYRGLNPEKRSRHLKFALRLLLAACVAAASLRGIPLARTLLVGGALGFAIESFA